MVHKGAGLSSTHQTHATTQLYETSQNKTVLSKCSQYINIILVVDGDDDFIEETL